MHFDQWIARRDPEIMGGELCFSGTRVPVAALFDYLSAGRTVEFFLEGYPTVSPEQVKGILAAYGTEAREPLTA